MSDVKKAEWTLGGLVSLLVALVILAVWGFAIYTFGYAAIIGPALALTFLSMVALVFVTRG